MKCLIPSYDRVDRCKTVEYLHSIGIPKSEIYIATQNERDRAAYCERHSDKAQIVYREAHNCAGNRNTLVGLLEEGEIALFLDDDLRSLLRYVMPGPGEKYGHLEDMDKAAFYAMCDEAERIIEEEGAWLIGTAWSPNPVTIYRQMSQGKAWSWQKTLSGATLFVKKCDELHFDETLDCLDDTELCLRYMQLGMNVLRVSEWAMEKPKDTTEVGGCYEVYESGKKIEVLKELDRRFYPLARHKNDWSGMQVRNGLR